MTINGFIIILFFLILVILFIPRYKNKENFYTQCNINAQNFQMDSIPIRYPQQYNQQANIFSNQQQQLQQQQQQQQQIDENDYEYEDIGYCNSSHSGDPMENAPGPNRLNNSCNRYIYSRGVKYIPESICQRRNGNNRKLGQQNLKNRFVNNQRNLKNRFRNNGNNMYNENLRQNQNSSPYIDLENQTNDSKNDKENIELSKLILDNCDVSLS